MSPRAPRASTTRLSVFPNAWPTKREFDEAMLTIAFHNDGVVIDEPRDLERWRSQRRLSEEYTRRADAPLYVEPVYPREFVRWFRHVSPLTREMTLARLHGMDFDGIEQLWPGEVHRLDYIDRKIAGLGPLDGWTRRFVDESLLGGDA